jgi:hypothetical protein
MSEQEKCRDDCSVSNEAVKEGMRRLESLRIIKQRIGKKRWEEWGDERRELREQVRSLELKLDAERKRGDEEHERAERLKDALYETDCLHNIIQYLEAHGITPMRDRELSQLWCYATTGDVEMTNSLKRQAEAGTQDGGQHE